MSASDPMTEHVAISAIMKVLKEHFEQKVDPGVESLPDQPVLKKRKTSMDGDGCEIAVEQLDVSVEPYYSFRVSIDRGNIRKSMGLYWEDAEELKKLLGTFLR